MNLGVDELSQGIRQVRNAQSGNVGGQTSSFAVTKGAGAGPGRVQDVISVDLRSSAFGTDAYAERKRSGQGEQSGLPDEDMLKVEHNAMALLSNTLSGEDYRRAMEEGYTPEAGEPSETVTITDRIKAVLVQSGTEIVGYTDSLDAAVIEEITGSASMAQALINSFSENDLPADKSLIKEAAEAAEQAVKLSAPDDAAIKYMVENRMDPTIKNFYLAESAAGAGNASAGGFYADAGGYMARKAEDIDLEKLGPQIDAVVERAGFSDKEAGKEARWMIENDLPLTEEGLRRTVKTMSVELPADIRLAAAAAAAAISDGRPASEGNLADPVSLNKRAEALMQRQELEEARLYMSVDANRRLLDKGVEIDTLPMEELIDELKTAREELARRLFPETRDSQGLKETLSAAEKLDIFESSVNGVSVIRSAPAAMVAAEMDIVARGTLSEIAKRGGDMTAKFSRAESTYEAVGTEVRADLGDKISKAFRNVDDILESMEMERSEDNRRAVRILGYNSMEIDEESVKNIREQDLKLRDVTERLKPAAVLQLIRDGRNPLNMTLDELKQELDQNGEDADESARKFARFLYKLEKSDAITEEERESYIGIYRLFNTLEKTDHAAIGAVLDQGGEMTIGNLLRAARSAKTVKRGMDYTVDDGFGGLKSKLKTPSISAQISSAFNYYSERAHSVYEHIDPLKLDELGPTEEPDSVRSREAASYGIGSDRIFVNDKLAFIEETTLPELADAMEAPLKEEARSVSDAADRAYAEEQAESIRREASAQLASNAAEELSDIELPATFQNLQAMRALQNGRRKTDSVWDALAKLNARGADADSIKSAMGTIEDALSSGERFEEIYKDKTQEMIDDLDQMMEDAGSSIDIKSMLLMKRQLTVATHAADSGSFDIPVELDGGEVNLHVTLRDADGEGSAMTASVPTRDHGVLTLSLSIKDGAVEGILNSSEPESGAESEWLSGVRGRFLTAAGEITGGAAGEPRISLIYRAAAGHEMEAAPGDSTDNETMFKLAKAFVEAVR